MQEMDTVTMCSNPNLEGPSLQNIRLMYPSILLPFWPPNPADVGARPVAVIVLGALSSVIPQPACTSKSPAGLQKYVQIPGLLPNFLTWNLARNCTYFLNPAPDLGTTALRKVLTSVDYCPFSSCIASSHLFAYYPSTFVHYQESALLCQRSWRKC